MNRIVSLVCFLLVSELMACGDWLDAGERYNRFAAEIQDIRSFTEGEPLVLRLNPLLAFAWGVFQEIIGVSRPSELFARLDEFSSESVISSIRIPVLSLIGESEGAEVKRQAAALHRMLSHPESELRVVTREEGGDAHCVTSNLPLMNEITFAWLGRQIEAMPDNASVT